MRDAEGGGLAEDGGAEAGGAVAQDVPIVEERGRGEGGEGGLDWEG